jgi:hypothetical protein
MPAYRLGCASSYRAAIKRQGGALWTWVDGLDTIKWGRKRDDYSEASITVSKTLAGSSCCNKLADTHSWAHELAILRDDQLVWEGPITRRIERRASFSFEARDMIAWLDRLDTATRAVVVGGQPLDPTTGQPIQDVAPILGVSGGYDTYYGLVENLTSSSGITDTAVANGIAAARRSYGYPPPIDLVVPSGAQLSPHAPADINQLIPGAPFLVEMGESYCSTIAQAYRLNELEVTWLASEVEQVAVSLASNGPILEVA